MADASHGLADRIFWRAAGSPAAVASTRARASGRSSTAAGRAQVSHRRLAGLGLEETPLAGQRTVRSALKESGQVEVPGLDLCPDGAGEVWARRAITASPSLASPSMA